MARGDRSRWWELLKRMNQALPLCRGRDAESGARWVLFGLPGNLYFVIETAPPAGSVPAVIPATYEAAVALYDDALRRFAPTLDVKRAMEEVRRRLADGEGPQKSEN